MIIRFNYVAIQLFIVNQIVGRSDNDEPMTIVPITTLLALNPTSNHLVLLPNPVLYYVQKFYYTLKICDSYLKTVSLYWGISFAKSSLFEGESLPSLWSEVEHESINV